MKGFRNGKVNECVCGNFGLVRPKSEYPLRDLCKPSCFEEIGMLKINDMPS